MSFYDKFKIYRLEEEINSFDDERIFIKTGEEKNLLELSRKNPKIKKIYKQLLANDYISIFS